MVSGYFRLGRLGSHRNRGKALVNGCGHLLLLLLVLLLLLLVFRINLALVIVGVGVVVNWCRSRQLSLSLSNERTVARWLPVYRLLLLLMAIARVHRAADKGPLLAA